MFEGFSKDSIAFFQDISENNNRDWFAQHKARYEDVVLKPALALTTEIAAPLKKVSPFFTAIPKRSGGSLMRIYRDIRFSKNKTPYKTNLGIQFRHEAGKDVHAPGFYFHIDADRYFVGAGIWRPDNEALRQIRELIDDDPARWKRVKNRKPFRESFELIGNSLKRPPRGYDVDHPLIEDLKRKDHMGKCNLHQSDLFDPKLIDKLIERFKIAMPYVRFLCDALHLPS